MEGYSYLEQSVYKEIVKLLEKSFEDLGAENSEQLYTAPPEIKA